MVCKMAKVWLSILVLMLIHDVFAVICPSEKNVKSCDECIRCGGMWCSNTETPHCSYNPNDAFCSGDAETKPSFPHMSDPGTALSYNYFVWNAYVGSRESMSFTYKDLTYKQVEAVVLNSTQNKDAIVLTSSTEPKCNNVECKVTINAVINKNFCYANGTMNELVYANVKVEGLSETLTIKYHVPCACNCTTNAVQSSPKCSSNGAFVCGTCACYDGWCGKDCSYKSDEIIRKSPKCKEQGDLICGNCNCHVGWKGKDCGIPDPTYDCKDHKREDHGDVPCQNDAHNIECSGNGYCSKCEVCECYKDMPYSRYFDHKNYCSDICMETSGCDSCMTNGTVGECFSPREDQCLPSITLLDYNKTIAQEEDEFGKIWVPCNGIFRNQGSNCSVKYVAMREGAETRVMIIESCNQHEHDAFVYNDTKVPIILGVLFPLAALIGIAGFMAWKHFGKTPAPYFNVGDETNVDGENCVGENPLYKPPTSTFTNPQFGKC